MELSYNKTKRDVLVKNGITDEYAIAFLLRQNSTERHHKLVQLLLHVIQPLLLFNMSVTKAYLYSIATKKSSISDKLLTLMPEELVETIKATQESVATLILTEIPDMNLAFLHPNATTMVHRDLIGFKALLDSLPEGYEDEISTTRVMVANYSSNLGLEASKQTYDLLKSNGITDLDKLKDLLIKAAKESSIEEVASLDLSITTVDSYDELFALIEEKSSNFFEYKSVFGENGFLGTIPSVKKSDDGFGVSEYFDAEDRHIVNNMLAIMFDEEGRLQMPVGIVPAVLDGNNNVLTHQVDVDYLKDRMNNVLLDLQTLNSFINQPEAQA